MSRKSKKPKFFDNERFIADLKEYHETGSVKLSEYIGECLLNLAKAITSSHKYTNYPFKDDLIQVAIMDCIKYIDCFDYNKYNNPFGYFSLLIHRNIWKGIATEKKALGTKFRVIEEYITHNQYDSSKVVIDMFGSDYTSENRTQFLTDLEVKAEEKKRKSRAKLLQKRSLIKE
jgi:DNA-directed RNA polymerase specialized sigma subunit